MERFDSRPPIRRDFDEKEIRHEKVGGFIRKVNIDVRAISLRNFVLIQKRQCGTSLGSLVFRFLRENIQATERPTIRNLGKTFNQRSRLQIFYLRSEINLTFYL